MVLNDGRRPLYGLLAFGLVGAAGFFLGVLTGIYLCHLAE